MVLPQDFDSEFQNNKKNKIYFAAAPLDRFFAFVLDYFLISPFVVFIEYLCFSEGFALLKANPESIERIYFYILLFPVYVMIFSLLQSLFVVRYSATPGQYFLKLKMIPSESEVISFWRITIRQILFWFGFFGLGLPYLTILTHPERTTFYDRVARLNVVTPKSESVFVGFEMEYRYWNSVLTTFAVFVILLFSVGVWKQYKRITDRIYSFATLEKKNNFCSGLEDLKVSERLEYAIALNLVNQFSDECLDKESDFVLWGGRSDLSALAYYAKSLTTEDSDEEKKYLAKVCESVSEKSDLSCRVANAFATSKFDDLYASLTESGFFAAALKYELSLILDRSEDIQKNFSGISPYNNLKLVKKYQIREFVQNTANVETSTSGRSPASTSNEWGRDELLQWVEDL